MVNGITQTGSIMKRCFLSYRPVISAALIFCLPLLFHCTHTEPVSKAIIESPLPEKESVGRLLMYSSFYPETRCPEAGKEVPPAPHKIVIPGPAMHSTEFIPGTEAAISLDGVTLSLSAGSINRRVLLSVTGLLAEDLPPIPEELVNVTGDDYAGYRFLPHGMMFDSAASIAMAYDNTLIPEGYTAEDVYTFYFDESDNKWKPIARDSIKHGSSLIVSSTLHFTDMINGIIMVPESPETEGFVPTSITDIKAANPAAGIFQMSPPGASNEGDAELSFILKLPSGRAGLEPRLSLQYSSDATSGWTGYGWGLSISGISVDISWGVPRYLPDKESETYIFTGSHLTPVAHRAEYADRVTEKRFYQRIEGDFSKIIRHGDNPGNYWWEVTAKDGVRNCYGGLPGTGVIPQAVSSDANGNIGYWALTETRDLHDNFISYMYDKPEECGEQLYIREIAYTGHLAQQGPYKITFLRNEGSDTFERRDGRITAAYGFIQRDSELLRRIEITYNDTPVRSYTLQFTDGVFNKSLLESITELDAAGEEFYTHRFDYYNDINSNNTIQPFNTEKIWNLPDDDLKSPYLNIFTDDISVLGGSGSTGGSGKVSATVGLLDGRPFLKTMTAGGNVSYQSSTNEGFLTLIDINGDGLPDKVYKKENGVYYRPNLLGYPGTEMFGERKLLTGINNFSLSKTTGFGWGAEASPPASFIGYENVNSKTKTEIYFADFNADGLVDLLDNGVVYFNHINESGDPVFTASSDQTPNPLYANSQIDLSILPDPAEEQALLEEQFPLHDAVRMWQAPYSGVIAMNAPVHLIEDTGTIARTDSFRDGVKTVIQHRGVVLWSTLIEADDYSVKIPDVNLIPVDKGDRIYFRVQSIFNGSYDKVSWDPEITYHTINESDTLAKLEDSNRKKIGRYRASEDFILTGHQSVGMPKTGRITIRSAFSKQVTSDSIRIEIVFSDTLENQSVILSRNFYPSELILNDSINLDLEVLKDEYVRFRIISSTNIDWSSLEWGPCIEYARIDDGTPLTDSDGIPLLSFKAIPEFLSMYVNPVRHELAVIADTSFMISLGLDTVDSFVHPLKVTPNLMFSLTGVDNVVLSVKAGNRISGKKFYPVNGNQLISDDTLFAEVQLWDTLYFEYHCSNFRLAENISRAEVIIGEDTLKASLFSTINPADEIFGPLYRGWGYFDYNGNGDRADSPIDESLLKLTEIRYDNVASMQDTSDLNGIQNPQDDIFNIMIPYAERDCFIGTDEHVYVTAQTVSSSRLGEKNVYVAPVVISESGLNAISKEIQLSSKSVAAGLSTLSYSHSWGKENIVTDMMDMNGDRYPDLLTTDNIQYTGVKGVLSGASVLHSLGDHYSESEADGFTLGGNFVYAKSNNSGSKTPSGNNKSKKGDNAKTNSNAKSAGETSKSSIGISGSFSTNEDRAHQTWLDINGDGLPDKIYSNGIVRLNLGYSFAAPEQWNFDAICHGESEDIGGGIGVNIANGSFTAGVSVSKTDNESTATFMDINSDGLPDMVRGNSVSFNTGSGFASPAEWLGLGALDAGKSVGQSANTGFTVGIAIPIFFIKICINPSASISSGVSHTLTQVADIDGDGMPDFLSSESEGALKVRSSKIFRTNILKKVENPLGSEIMLDYLLTPCTYRHPGGKLALASVKTYDGLAGDGIDTTYTTFGYEDGFYERSERQFYGFANVSTNYHDTGNDNNIYRTLEQQFGNSDYYTKGRLLAETISDREGRNYKGLQNIYSLHDIHTGTSLPENYSKSNREPLFVALEESRQYSYSGASEPQITTRVTYTYDTLGNISGYTDHSSGNENDIYSVSIAYHSDSDSYLFSVPSNQELTTSEGLRRKRETIINESGKIIRIIQSRSSSQTAIFDMEYDEFGNLTKITRPANYQGERLWYEYEYDESVHSFITRITDAYGYESSSVYDYRWGVPVEATDRNNRKIRYEFDDRGRMTTVTGPCELASGKPYTIAFEYHPDEEFPYARTMHYDTVYDSNIETYSFTDGMGRPVQVKKSALLFSDAAAEDDPGYIVSGRVMYDAFNRVAATYHPVFETASDPETYNDSKDNIQPSVIEYDVLDRIKRITLPDGSVTRHSYNTGDYGGEVMYIDSLNDALNNTSVIYTRANGRKAAMVRISDAGEITTQFQYNALGELLKLTDPLGNKTISSYDMAGNRISVSQPDAGLTEFTYDEAGNMISKITANLRKQIPDGGAITYKYDHERLVEIIYPRNIQNRVNYTYGEPGAPYNRAGRVVLIQDASGGQEFFYSPLGQVKKTIRTIQLGESDMRTWIWSTSYDTWNRVHSMTYPDGEVVKYSYNRAGNLHKISGEKLGRSYEYISRIGYNKYEKKVYQLSGNGAETTYNYEPERLRLKEMNLSSTRGLLVNNSYRYDAMNNILGITGISDVSGDIGGEASHSYTYDEIYQLTRASGLFRGDKDTCRYALDLQYDIMGRILKKTQAHYKNSTEQGGTTYDFIYRYESPQPNAATVIGARQFLYDENGNMGSWQDTVTNDFRQLSWDEENRLTLISDNGYLNRYVYDANGERVIKSHGGTQGVYINGAPAAIVNHSADNYTIYVSPCFVFQNERFTKHYYAGSTRVASKIGNGQFQNQYRPGIFEISAGRVDYINRQQQLKKSVVDYEAQQGIAPGPPTIKGIYADPSFSGTAYPDAGTPDGVAPRGWPKKPVYAPPGGPPGAPVQWGNDVTNDNVTPGFGFAGNGSIEEIMRYFYHTDHLGSAIYITNAIGDITQYVAYMPFGETFAEQHSDWDSPYKFNAKEIDNETGLYYYGARYYDPKVSLWLGVDPYAEEYTGISPYAYCQNNPVIYLDPDGKRIVLSGTIQQKNTILQHLQQLSDMRLSYNDETGVVTASTYLSKVHDKVKGTALINRLIGSAEITEISVRENRGNAASPPGNGKNAKVYFDPMANPDIKTEDPVTGNVSGKKRPDVIGLGHELIHADHYIKGDVDRSPTPHWFKRMGNWIKQTTKSEELRTVGLRGIKKDDITENDLRKEQNGTKNQKRGAY